MLDVLEVPIPSRALPLRTQCPLCLSFNFRLYADKAAGGFWFCCSGCKKFGDLLQLASKKWSLGIQATVVRLAEAGCDLPTDRASVQSYSEELLRRRQQVSQCWRTARHRSLYGNTELVRLARELHLDHRLHGNRAVEGPGRLLGIADRNEIMALRQPCRRKQEHDRSSPARRRDDSRLISPLWDLPYRVCGFLTIRADTEEPEIEYVRIPPHRFQRSGARGEGGLLMHPAVPDESYENWDSHVLAVEDPLLAMRLQIANFDRSSRPLPIVAWQHEIAKRRLIATDLGWDWLYDKHVVFWLPKLSVNALLHVIRCNGRIVSAGPRFDDPTAWTKYLQEDTPKQLTTKLLNTAKPWPVVVAGRMSDMPNNELAELLLQLQLDSDDLQRLLRHCSSELRERIQGIKAVRQLAKTVEVDGLEFSEHNDCWYLKTSDRRILLIDATLRIDEVIRDEAENEIFYRGEIRHAGDSLPFCEPSRVVERDTFDWMNQYCQSQGFASLSHGSRHSRLAVAIAKRLHKPEFRNANTRLGWQPAASLFLLTGFAISLGGDVTARNSRFGRGPTERLPFPEPLLPEDVKQLIDPKHANTLWPILLPLLGCVLADACHYDGYGGVGLCGDATVEAGRQLTSAFGCLHRRFSKERDVEVLLRAERRHAWPLYVEPSLQLPVAVKQQWLQIDAEPRRAVTAMNWWEYSLQSLRHGWTLVCIPSRSAPPPRTLLAVRRFVSAYLVDLASRRLQLKNWQRRETLLLDLADDIQTFFANIGVRTKRLRDSLQYVREASPYGHATAFAELVSELVLAEELQVTREGFSSSQPGVLLQTDAGLLVPYESLVETLAARQLKLGDPETLSQVLRTAGVLRQETGTGWEVDWSWWYSLHVARKALGSRRFLSAGRN